MVVTIELGTRLGLNVHRDQWPTAPLLDSYESAGFSWVQVHTPPRPMLADGERCRSHARALRAALAPHGLRLLLHGPDDLSAGTIEHDRAFDGLMDYAAEAGAELVVYHGLAFAKGDCPPTPAFGDHRQASGLGDCPPSAPSARAIAEERSLQRFAARAEALGLTIAIENLAPVYPTPAPPRICHDPLAVRDLVRRLASPAMGMLLDVGHAHLSASLRGESAERAVRAVLDDVVLFHVHDNLGARRHDLGAPGVDPLKLDLHLPPGAGCLPWDRLGPLLAEHRAPLMLEVERSHGVAPAALATGAAALLRRATAPAASVAA
jgi:sugar phosphate isomerase/epimerase